MKQKFRITLEVEVDPTAVTNGLRNGNPGRWNWRAISAVVDVPDITVTVQDYFVACCDEKIEWYRSDANVGGAEFPAYLHDESCVNHAPIEEDDGE